MTLPDPVLKQVAKPVDRVDDGVREQMERMLATMYAAKGIGLAANQVNLLNRVIVVDVDQDAENPSHLFMANPEILDFSDDRSVYNEGCLSLPEQYAEVERPARIRVKYLDYDNAWQEMEADGLLATCIQHEIDHLNGHVFIDHVSALKRNMIIRRLKKMKKDAKIL